MTESDVKALAIKALQSIGAGAAVMLPIVTSGKIAGTDAAAAFAGLTTFVLFGFGVWDFLHVKSAIATAAATGSVVVAKTPPLAAFLLPLLIVGGAVGLGGPLVGCASLSGAALTTSQTVEKSITDAQVAADAAVLIADGLVTTKTVSLAVADKIKAIADAADGYAKQARTYYKAGNLVLAAAQLANLQAVPTQLAATSPVVAAALPATK